MEKKNMFNGENKNKIIMIILVVIVVIILIAGILHIREANRIKQAKQITEDIMGTEIVLAEKNKGIIERFFDIFLKMFDNFEEETEKSKKEFDENVEQMKKDFDEESKQMENEFEKNVNVLIEMNENEKEKNNSNSKEIRTEYNKTYTTTNGYNEIRNQKEGLEKTINTNIQMYR